MARAANHTGLEIRLLDKKAGGRLSIPQVSSFRAKAAATVTFVLSIFFFGRLLWRGSAPLSACAAHAPLMYSSIASAYMTLGATIGEQKICHVMLNDAVDWCRPNP